MHRSTFEDREAEAVLDRDGFAVVPFLDAETLDAVRAVHRELGGAPDDPGFSIRFGFWSQDTAWKRAVHEAVVAVVAPRVAALFADHRIIYAMFITKWPGPRGAFGPHQDPWFVDEGRFRSVTTWCPLVDTPPPTGPDNGSLHFVPGSHRLSSAPRIYDASAFQFAGAEELIVGRLGRQAPLRAGEAVVFDNGVVHYSFENGSDQPRTVLALGLVPAEAPTFFFQPGDEGQIRVFAIDDDFFIEHNPFSLSFGAGDRQEVARLPHVPPVFDLASLEALATGDAPSGSSNTSAATPPEPGGAFVADAHCFLCGGTDGLEDAPTPDHTSVMLVCTVCAGPLEARYRASGAAPTPARRRIETPPPRRSAAAGAPRPVLRDPTADEHLRAEGWALLRVGPAAAALTPERAAVADLVDALCVDHAPILARTNDGTGPAPAVAADGLTRAWTLTDEADGRRAALLVAPGGGPGAAPVTVEVAAGSHERWLAGRGPGLAAGERHEPVAEADAHRAITVQPGEVLVVDPALRHRPLTTVAGAVLVAIGPTGAAPMHLRGLPDGRVARYEVDGAFLATAPLYGDAGPPTVCPLAIHGPDPDAVALAEPAGHGVGHG